MKNNVKFEEYENMLREWSGRMNLVAPSTLNDIKTRHIADSAQLADVLPHDVHVIDLGSGAGFPAVVLAILGWNVTCIESIGKKVAFLSAVKEKLKEKNIPIIAEDTGLNYGRTVIISAETGMYTIKAVGKPVKEI